MPELELFLFTQRREDSVSGAEDQPCLPLIMLGGKRACSSGSPGANERGEAKCRGRLRSEGAQDPGLVALGQVLPALYAAAGTEWTGSRTACKLRQWEGGESQMIAFCQLMRQQSLLN